MRSTPATAPRTVSREETAAPTTCPPAKVVVDTRLSPLEHTDTRQQFWLLLCLPLQVRARGCRGNVRRSRLQNVLQGESKGHSPGPKDLKEGLASSRSSPPLSGSLVLPSSTCVWTASGPPTSTLAPTCCPTSTNSVRTRLFLMPST